MPTCAATEAARPGRGWPLAGAEDAAAAGVIEGDQSESDPERGEADSGEDEFSVTDESLVARLFSPLSWAAPDD